MSTPIQNAFPANRKPGRGNIVCITDFGPEAGKQRYDVKMTAANGEPFFQAYPERFATPGGIRSNLLAVRKCIDDLLKKNANVVHVQGKPPRKKKPKGEGPTVVPPAPKPVGAGGAVAL